MQLKFIFCSLNPYTCNRPTSQLSYMAIFFMNFSNSLFRSATASHFFVGTETAESLKAKVQDLEGQTFVAAVELFRSGKVGPYSNVCSQPAPKGVSTEVK